jgi:hypothetical protein
MDKKDWEESLKRLKALIPLKKLEIERAKKDIEELEWTISCYEKRLSKFSDTERKPKK